MKEYTIVLTVEEIGSVKVQAESEAEAIDKAYEAEADGQAWWGSRDIISAKVDEVEEIGGGKG